MSIVIFFGGALVVIIVGLIVIGVTFYHWYKEYKLKKIAQKNIQKNAIKQEISK